MRSYVISMVNSHCFVPGCKSGWPWDRRKRKLEGRKNASLFSVPADVDLFEKWKGAIQRTDRELTKDCKVCELHFLESDIERYFITKLPDGSRIEKIRPSLKSGAIPKVFLNPPVLTKAAEKRKLSSIWNRNRTLKKCKENESKAESLPDFVKTSQQSTSDVPVSLKLEAGPFTFEKITENIEYIQKPTCWWSVNSSANFIICAKWNKAYIPEKRVVIESSLAFKVFLKDKEIEVPSMTDITCIEDISCLLEKVEKYIICQGADDRSMPNCLGYVPDRTAFPGRHSVWCKECKITRKKMYYISRKPNVIHLTFLG